MFWLIFAVILWGILHSLTASLRFKDAASRILGAVFMKFYRLFYNIVAVISFIPVLYLMVHVPNETIYQVPDPWSYFMRMGQWISMILLLIAVLQTDVLSFAGLRQVFEGEQKGKLVIEGFYRYVRHPLYTFGFLILWLTPAMTKNTFIVYFALTIYILVGIYFEERKLLREFGQDYVDYRSITPMLIPRFKPGGNK